MSPKPCGRMDNWCTRNVLRNDMVYNNTTKQDILYFRFQDLKERGIVNNRRTLSRWIQKEKFPKPVRLAPRSAAFSVAAVVAWLAERERRNPIGRFAGRPHRNALGPLKAEESPPSVVYLGAVDNEGLYARLSHNRTAIELCIRRETEMYIVYLQPEIFEALLQFAIKIGWLKNG